MRIGISNIAWDPLEDEAVADLLVARGLDAIDVAPGKYFPAPASATESQISKVRDWWLQRGIALTGMQALLFGTSGLNLFGAAEVQQAMLAHLAAVCRIGSVLGASRLVFGSPKNRDRQGLSDEVATEMAVDFFRRLGDIAGTHGVLVCLEPNPPRYGANFMTTSEETARIVTLTDHPAIRMQLDTGAMHINGEDISRTVEQFAPLVGHIHASEPDLLPLGDGGVDHGEIHQVLLRRLPHHVVTVEMLTTKEEPHVQSIGRALTAAATHYKPDGAGATV